MIRNNLFVLIPLLVIYLKKSQARTFSVDYANHQFLKDGQPFQYISGTFHYFRVHPDLWEDRLKRVRALGLNVIQTYIPWNMVEPTEGNFDFTGINNLTRLFTIAQQNDLYINLRTTPYINGEFEYGGLPYWLLKHDGIQLRSSDPKFLNAVQNYYNGLLPVIKPYLYKNGGPILMLQIENEYGNFGCDHTYTYWLRDALWAGVGNDTVLWTTDGPSDHAVPCGHVNGTLTTVDFAPDTNLGAIDSHFQIQDKYSGGGPHVNSEFYTDWYLFWGAPKSFLRNFYAELIVNSLSHMFYNNKASVNLYLVQGGTNFGFWNGQQWNGQVITSYWVGSPILDNGNITDKYLAIRSFIQNITNWPNPPLAVPANNPDDIYGYMVEVVNSIPRDIYGEANDESLKLMKEIFIDKHLITYIVKQSHGNIIIINNEGDHARDVFDELTETMNLRTEEEIQETIYFDGTAAYGKVQLTRLGQNLISTLTQIQETCVSAADPVTFEKIDHGYGFVLYTTTLTSGGTILTAPNIRDYGYVFLNNVYQGMLNQDKNVTKLTLTTAAQAGDTLRILVENHGRLCYVTSGPTYPLEIKGLQAGVTLNSAPLKNWYSCGINLTQESVNSLNSHFLDKNIQATSSPGVYVGYFDADALQDTYFDSTGWGKGQLFINGFNLGRYWPSVGPQITLYVPSPILRAKNNTVLLIELVGGNQNYINFINQPNFIFNS